MNGERARRTGPVVADAPRVTGSVTHAPDSPLFERRTGLGGPTALGHPEGVRAATRPVWVEPVHG